MNIRVWSKTLDKFLPNDEWWVNFKGDLYWEDMMDGNLVKAPDESYIISRFTELYDMYSLPLFEGDIVRLYHYNSNIVGEDYIINYNSGRWMLGTDKQLTEYFLNHKKYKHDCKVVKMGNIYETKII